MSVPPPGMMDPGRWGKRGKKGKGSSKGSGGGQHASSEHWNPAGAGLSGPYGPGPAGKGSFGPPFPGGGPTKGAATWTLAPTHDTTGANNAQQGREIRAAAATAANVAFAAAKDWDKERFNDHRVEEEYMRVRNKHFSNNAVRQLELSGILEKYLWPNVLIVVKGPGHEALVKEENVVGMFKRDGGGGVLAPAVSKAAGPVTAVESGYVGGLAAAVERKTPVGLNPSKERLLPPPSPKQLSPRARSPKSPRAKAVGNAASPKSPRASPKSNPLAAQAAPKAVAGLLIGSQGAIPHPGNGEQPINVDGSQNAPMDVDGSPAPAAPSDSDSPPPRPIINDLRYRPLPPSFVMLTTLCFLEKFRDNLSAWDILTHSPDPGLEEERFHFFFLALLDLLLKTEVVSGSSSGGKNSSGALAAAPAADYSQFTRGGQRFTGLNKGNKGGYGETNTTASQFVGLQVAKIACLVDEWLLSSVNSQEYQSSTTSPQSQSLCVVCIYFSCALYSFCISCKIGLFL